MNDIYLRGFIKAAVNIDNLSNKDINTIVRQPHIQNYVETLKERKKTKERATGYGLPITGAMLGGAGFGLKALGDNSFTQADRGAIEDLAGLSARIGKSVPPTPEQLKEAPWKKYFPDVEPSKDFQGSPALFWDYLDRASRASKVKIFNKPALDVLHDGKKYLGFPDGPLDKDPSAWQIEAKNHYPAFQKGPVDAYAHQILKNFTESYAYEYPDRFLKYPNDMHTNAFKLTDQDRRSIHTMLNKTPTPFESQGNPSNTFIKNWKNEFDTYLKDKGFAPSTFTEKGMQLDPNIQSLNHAQQLDVAKNFSTYLANKDPNLAQTHDNLLKSLAGPQAWASRNYSVLGRTALTALQDIPRGVGKGMMAAGGGLGLLWLINKLRHARHKKEQPKDVLTSEPTTT